MFILEFSILALLSTIIVALKGGTKSIVLVENSPKFTSTNRAGVFGMLRKFQCKICDKILTNNQGGFDYLVNELGVDPSKIIQSIYLTSSIAPAGLPSRDVAGAEKVKFVCIGRLIDGKGFLALIHEVATLDEAERARVEIDVFGNGPLRDMLQSEIDKNALSDVIRLRGNIPYAELGSRIAGADAFIMPTLEDYRSLASFEALSLGLPLLISIYDGANVEVLAHGENGLLINPRERGSIANAIRIVLESPALLQEMRVKSIERAKKFTVDQAASNIAQAFERVLVD